MSVWTSVEGSVTVREGCKLSLKTLITEMFSEAQPSVAQNSMLSVGRITYTFSFNFSDSNMYAAKTIESFIYKIKEFDKTAWVDLEANIRFVS